MSVMLYPCMLCVSLLMCLFVLCVACLTVFVNCLVKQLGGVRLRCGCGECVYEWYTWFRCFV